MSEKIIMVIKGRPQNVLSELTLLQIAELCYSGYRDYLISQSQPPGDTWAGLNGFQQQGIVSDVEFFITNINLTAQEIHDNWRAEKEADGWVYGVIKDIKARTHPYLVAYASLPELKKQRDSIFKTTIDANVSVEYV